MERRKKCKKVKKCSLAENINECQYFDKKSKGCNNSGKCSFQIDNEETIANEHGYIREERWYEKYHKGTRRI